jgi:hypothetical protein
MLNTDGTLHTLDHRDNLLHAVTSVLPRWQAWLRYLVMKLDGHEAWAERVKDDPDLNDLRLHGDALRLQYVQHLEHAVCHMHDLWCLRAWLLLDDGCFIEFEGLLGPLTTDLAARLGRAMSQENLTHMPPAEEATFDDDWAEVLSGCAKGRALLEQHPVAVEPDADLLPAPLPPLPSSPVFSDAVAALIKSHERLTDNQRRRAFLQQLRNMMRKGPFAACPLMASHAATALNECEAMHVHRRDVGVTT